MNKGKPNKTTKTLVTRSWEIWLIRLSKLILTIPIRMSIQRKCLTSWWIQNHTWRRIMKILRLEQAAGSSICSISWPPRVRITHVNGQKILKEQAVRTTLAEMILFCPPLQSIAEPCMQLPPDFWIWKINQIKAARSYIKGLASLFKTKILKFSITNIRIKIEVTIS